MILFASTSPLIASTRSSSQEYIVSSLSDMFSYHPLCDVHESCSMRAGHTRDRRMFAPTQKERSEKSVFKCYVGSASHPRAENMFSFSQRWGEMFLSGCETGSVAVTTLIS